MEQVTASAASPDGGDDAPRPGSHRRRATGALVLVGLVLALGVGIYAFVQELDKTSTAKSMATFCNSVGLVMQLAYDHKGGLATLHRLVDKYASAVGGHVLSDTRAFELALGRRDTSSAQKYLLQLDGLCRSEGSPISTPLTT
jgi:hypothetical protein